MVDNINDDTLDNQIIPQQENLAEENLLSNETDSFTQNQETENMEVHHHTHPGHGKKTWKEYFWEFLMLFLAVFCGFLAEWQLEHVIEHQREEKLVASLLEDLKKDTVEILQVNIYERLQKMNDSLRSEIEKPSSKRNNLLMYKWFAKIRQYGNFEYHNRTIEQLKNGGNFRLIRKANLSDSLIDYDALIVSYLRDQEAQSKDIYQKLNFLQDKFVNSKYYSLKWKDESKLDSIYKVDPTFFKIPDRYNDDLFEYHNNLEFYAQMMNYRIRTLNNMKRKAKNLIELINKEY